MHRLLNLARHVRRCVRRVPAFPGQSPGSAVRRLLAHAKRVLFRRERGVGLFTSVLGIVVVGVLMVLAAALSERWGRAALADRAAAAASELADATAAHLRADWGTVQAAAAAAPGRISEVTLADLQAAGELPATFAASTRAFGNWGILVRDVPIGGGDSRLEVLVVARGAFEEGEALAAAGRASFGAVAASSQIAPGRLRGAGLDVNAAPWRARATTLWGTASPALGDIAFFASHHPAALFGPALYRVAVPGRPDLNTMQADLDLDGNDLVNADRLEVDELAIAGAMEVGGALAVAGTATVNGLVSADSIEAAGGITAASLAVAGDIEANTIEAALGEVRAANGDFERLTVGSCTGC